MAQGGETIGGLTFLGIDKQLTLFLVCGTIGMFSVILCNNLPISELLYLTKQYICEA